VADTAVACITDTLAIRARELGQRHRAAGTAPFGSPDYVTNDAGGAALLAALGVTGPVTAENEPELADVVEVYCNSLEGPAPALRTYPVPAGTRTMAEIIDGAQPVDCGSCGACSGVPCLTDLPGGTHIARLARAVRLGRITNAGLAYALAGFGEFSGASVVRP
jgi:hypothetical protein